MKGKLFIATICSIAGLGAIGLLAGLLEKTGMPLTGPYVHHIDPVIGTVLGVHLWWYGLSYTLGFFNAKTRRGKGAEGLTTDGQPKLGSNLDLAAYGHGFLNRKERKERRGVRTNLKTCGGGDI